MPHSDVTVTTGVAMVNPTLDLEYFELDSKHVGDRFAISVSLPKGYQLGSGAPFPLFYATDGNAFAPILEVTRFLLEGFDAEPPIEACIQVNIGYPAEQAAASATLRNRDLIPPRETVPTYFAEHVRTRLGPGAAPEAVERLVRQYESGAADKFLRFIEEELHPEIQRRYPLDPERVGLFGYSSGGLFSLYAMTSGSALFRRVGACSPGIHVATSAIFQQYEHLVADPAAALRPDVRLHITLNEQELMGSVRLYRGLAINTLRFLDLMSERPLPGLVVTTDLIAKEGHYTGYVDAYRSFVRACYRPAGA